MRRITSFVLPALLGLASISHAQPTKNDALGDPLPRGSIARLGTLRWRAGSPVVIAAYRPDGKSLVTIGQDFVVQVWDTATGREVRRFDASGSNANNIEALGGRLILSSFNGGAALSADGKTLACSSRDGFIRIWDVDAGKELRQINNVSRGGLNRIALSHDGKTLAVTNYPIKIFLYDTNTGNQTRQFGADPTNVSRFLPYRVEFGPDAKTLFVAGLEIGVAPQTPLLAIWDTVAGKELHRIDKLLGNNGRNVTPKAAVTADLKFAALPYPDEIVVYDMIAAKELRKIKYNADYRTNVAFTADGKTLLAVTGKADVLAAWDVATGNLLRQIGTPPGAVVAVASVATRNMAGLAIAPDGKIIALMDGPTIVPVNAETGKPVNPEFGHSSGLKEAFFAPDGKTVLTRAADYSLLRWNSEAGKVIGGFSIPGLAASSYVYPSRNLKWAFTREPTGTTRFLDAATGKDVFTVAADANLVNSGATIEFSPDSRIVGATARNGSTAQLYDAATGQKKADLSLPPGPSIDPRLVSVMRLQSRRLMFSPDSRLMGVGSEGHLTIWDATTAAKVRVFPLPEGQVLRHAAIAPNGAVVAVEFSDGETALLETATAARRLTLFSGTPVAGSNPNAMLIRIGNDPNAFPLSLAFSPDGRLLARAGDDGKVRLWDARSGKELGTFEGHRGAVVSVAFSADGFRLVTAGTDTTALVWDLSEVRSKLTALTASTETKSLESLWAALSDSDAGTAHAAILALASDPARSVPFLKDRVKPIETPDPKRIAALIVNLSDAKFLVREKARKDLERLGELAAPALRDSLQNGASAQVRRLIQKTLEILDNRTYSTDQLAMLRAVEVLELAATPEAIAILKGLATGAPEAVPTPQAKSAVARLTK